MNLINKTKVYSKNLSICSIVTDYEVYQLLRKYFENMGFNDSNSEFLLADNSNGNQFSAYEAVKIFLNDAVGKYVLIIHQDAFPIDTYNNLISKIEKLECIDPNWGVVGNAGKKWNDLKKSYMSLVYNNTPGQHRFAPVKVDSIDENVMIIKGGSGITVSRDLSGYHFYGFDITSVAARLGYSVYVIDFPWKHLSPGTIDESFLESRDAIQKKMAAYINRHSLQTTCTTLYWGKNNTHSILSLCRSIQMLKNQEAHQNGVLLLLNYATNKHYGFAFIYKIYDITQSIQNDVSFFYCIKKRRLTNDLRWWKVNWKSRIKISIT